MPACDTLIHARWIIPVEPEKQVLERHGIAVRDGRIQALLPSDEAERVFTPEAVIRFADHALIPGLVNSHTHAAMSLLRGLADDLPLMTWLEEHIWPAERSLVNEQFAYDGGQLAIAEMLRGGTTCFNDMYFFPEATARAAAACGMRASVGLILIDFPTAYAADAEEYLDKGLALHDRYRNDPLISCAFAPHAPYSVSDAPLQKIRVLADELDLPIHMHVHETAAEVAQSVERSGARPLQRLRQLGLTGPSLLAVHMTQLTDTEIRQLAEDGVHVLHCPESNLKLASGFCPVQKLIDRGVNVALGTDGAASNNDLDMFGEMRTAALLAKAVHQDAGALPAAQALRMATLNGARALGLADHIGSLTPGKWADICAVRLNQLETQPVFDPISHLVYAAGRNMVTDVWVAGQHLLKDRRLTTLDEADILRKTGDWQHHAAGYHAPAV
jgi:5-methylthioadenosine/S-adenosylhomocysteine deaminase